ncbi:hypothetical protein [Lentzea flava]|uniref:Uncharacterized protein n=1 Tax=Lentzea flava TaxID=103732 RepID=A0ABQ2VI12_9PSEU|nr:hypothetical protein [Lentzea flava]MCP2205556.1 hypothetical protein [Lentzea flava]GGU88056.1 hypothetical protein GCM10010178_92140 [Lentzea flava]
MGNYTLPVTLLLEAAGADIKPGDPLSAQTLRAWGRADWEQGLRAARRVVWDHLHRAEWHLNQEFDRGGVEVALRMATWVRGTIESWRLKGLDAMLSDLPRQAAP